MILALLMAGACAVSTVGQTGGVTACNVPVVNQAVGETATSSNVTYSFGHSLSRKENIRSWGVPATFGRAAYYATLSPDKLSVSDIQHLFDEQDRALAAYPGLDYYEVMEAMWFGVAPYTVEMGGPWASSNAMGIDGASGRTWLEAGVYFVVRTKYPNRADDKTLAAYKAAQAAKRKEIAAFLTGSSPNAKSPQR